MIKLSPMPRNALQSLSQNFLIFVFSFICSFAVRLPYWRAILVISASGTLSSSAAAAAAATPQLLAPSRRIFAEREAIWTVKIIIPNQHDDLLGVKWETVLRTKQDKRLRHAGRYWRFVQVLRRPGRRRLQKHDHRGPDTDYRPERSWIREEGF